MTDYEIIQKVLNGDKELFQDLMEKYYKQLFYYVLPLLSNHHQDAQDVVSESFIKAYLNLNRFNFKSKFSSWIYKIAYHQAIDQLRKNKSHTVVDIEKAQNKNLETKKNWSMEFNLHRVLQKLKPLDKTILVMNYIQGLSITEISQKFSLEPKQISLKLHRAKNRAKKIAQQFN